jgi:hypothetical protein
VSYESLVEDPVSELARVFAFIDVPIDAQTIDYAQKILHGDSVEKPDPAPEATTAIVGDLLQRVACGEPN